jgi:4-amino-4-deoxy-L-arabinose transferase-like glycosyltransferase
MKNNRPPRPGKRAEAAASEPRAIVRISPRIALAAIVCLAAFLRFYDLAAAPPGLYHDEAMNGTNVLQNLESHRLAVFYPENNGREGLYIALATPVVAAFGNTSWALRLPSAVFGTATVLGVGLLGMELMGVTEGLLAAFLLATSFWHIVFSREAFRAILSPFFLCWSLLFLARALRAVRQGSSWIAPACIAAVIYGLGFYTYISYRVTPLLVAALLLHMFYTEKAGARTPILRLSAVFAGIAAAVAAPLAWYFGTHPGTFLGRTSQISVAANPHPLADFLSNVASVAGMFFTEGDPNWRHNIAGRPELFLPVGLLFLGGIAIAAVRLRSASPDVRLAPALLLGWLVLAAAPVALSNEGMPHSLRAILLIPAVALLAAIGARELWRLAEARLNPTIAMAVAALVCAALAGEAYYSYFHVWAPNPAVAQAFSSNSVAVAERINAMPAETPKYVVVVSSGDLVDGVPMPAEVVMYLTRTYSPETGRRKNVHYVIAPARTVQEIQSNCLNALRQFPQGTAFCI